MRACKRGVVTLGENDTCELLITKHSVERWAKHVEKSVNPSNLPEDERFRISNKLLSFGIENIHKAVWYSDDNGLLAFPLDKESSQPDAAFLVLKRDEAGKALIVVPTILLWSKEHSIKSLSKQSKAWTAFRRQTG